MDEPLPVEIVFDYVSPLSVSMQRWSSRLGMQSEKSYTWGLDAAKSLADIDPAYSVLAEESLRDLVNRRQRWLGNGYRWMTGSRYVEACAVVALNYLDDEFIKQC